jgi:hypothetical protein
LSERRTRLSAAKPHPRVFAFDDSPFTFKDKKVPLVGLVVTLPDYLEGVLRGELTVDGDDSTAVIAKLVTESPYFEAAQAIMLDGITFGGFNIVDLDLLHEKTGLPVVTVTRRRPDMEAMEMALSRHMPLREELPHLLRAHPLFSFPRKPQPLWVACVGATQAEASTLLKKSFVRGSFPEPLRLAHIVASAIPPAPTSKSRA